MLLSISGLVCACHDIHVPRNNLIRCALCHGDWEEHHGINMGWTTEPHIWLTVPSISGLFCTMDCCNLSPGWQLEVHGMIYNVPWKIAVCAQDKGSKHMGHM